MRKKVIPKTNLLKNHYSLDKNFISPKSLNYQKISEIINITLF